MREGRDKRKAEHSRAGQDKAKQGEGRQGGGTGKRNGDGAMIDPPVILDDGAE